jgi:hypothetical protein
VLFTINTMCVEDIDRAMMNHALTVLVDFVSNNLMTNNQNVYLAAETVACLSNWGEEYESINLIILEWAREKIRNTQGFECCMLLVESSEFEYQSFGLGGLSNLMGGKV